MTFLLLTEFKILLQDLEMNKISEECPGPSQVQVRGSYSNTEQNKASILLNRVERQTFNLLPAVCIRGGGGGGGVEGGNQQGCLASHLGL